MFIAIVPAYNEEKNIGSVVRSLFGHVDEVVVIDDASQDQTVSLAKEAGAKVLSHELNRGQGAALQTGHDYAMSQKADFVLHFDGDGQFDVHDIEPALKFLQEKNTDILFGSRFLDTRSKIPWTKKFFILPVARLVNRFFARISLSDAHNGFRILNKKALECIKISQDRMAHATEIVQLVQKHNLDYVEFPVKVVYREYGQRVSGGFRILKDLFFGRFVK